MKNMVLRGTKQFLVGLALILICILPMGMVYAAETDWEYEVNEGEATITAYNGTGGSISVPSTLDEYTVTAIADNVFSDNSTIGNVVIADTVEYIGSSVSPSDGGKRLLCICCIRKRIDVSAELGGPVTICLKWKREVSEEPVWM